MRYNGVVQRKPALLDKQVNPQPYVDMVRFRNLIVHQYKEIDPAILFDLATKRLDDFRKFRNEIDQLSYT